MAIFAATAVFIVLIIAAVQIGWGDSVEDREIRREEAIARAWDRLSRPSVGNIGKGNALSFLFAENESFDGVDLSCAASTGWDRERGICNAPPVLSGIDFTAARTPESMRSVGSVNLSGVKIYSFTAGNIALQADLTGTEIAGFSFRGVFLTSSVDKNTVMRRGALLDTDIGLGSGEMPVFEEVNVSGSTLYNLGKVKPPQAPGQIGLWFWADWPPYKLLANVADADLIAAGVTICRPPDSAASDTIDPRTERPITPHLPGGQPGCERMTLGEAKAAYPHVYRD